jgi:AcrR family transcriptional regulator
MRKPGSSGPETLRNLHSAAIQLLADRSYQGMNLRLLASKLGLQAGSLYNYIESKQQLLFWLMKDTTEKLLHGFENMIAEIRDPADQMRKFIAYHVAYHIANRKESSVLMTEMHYLTSQNYRAVKQLQRRYTDEVQAIVERGVAAGEFNLPDVRIATFVLLQMLTSIAQWYSPRGRLTVDELIAVYTDLSFAMLGAGPRASGLKQLNGVTSNRSEPVNGAEPVIHSLDIGSHVLQISIAPHPKPAPATNGVVKPNRSIHPLKVRSIPLPEDSGSD